MIEIKYYVENSRLNLFIPTPTVLSKYLCSNLNYVDGLNYAGTKRDACSDGVYAYYLFSQTNKIVKILISDMSLVAIYNGGYGTGDGQFKYPWGICTDGTYLYIADTNNSRITKHLCSDMSYVSKIGTLGAGNDNFNLPRGLCTDGTHVYVADTINNRIKKHLCSDLSYVDEIGGIGVGDDKFYYPYDVTTDETNLYVADTYNNRIKKHLCSDLSYISKIGSVGVGNDNFDKPNGIGTDATHVYVADTDNSRIKKHLCSDLSYVLEVALASIFGCETDIRIGIITLSFEIVIDTLFTEISSISTPEWINQDPEIDTNIWSKKPFTVIYALRVTDAEKWSLDQLLIAHTSITLVDDIYSIDDVYWIRSITSRWAGEINYTNPWLLEIELIKVT